jgi:hypothetical protein
MDRRLFFYSGPGQDPSYSMYESRLVNPILFTFNIQPQTKVLIMGMQNYFQQLQISFTKQFQT